MIPRYHLTAISGNRKTGPIAVTTTDRSTCPDSCPFKATINARGRIIRLNGCYPDGWPLVNHWNKLTRGERGTGLQEHIRQIAALPAGRMIRLNQAGDLPRAGRSIDLMSTRAIAVACSGRVAWSYTHHTDHRSIRGLKRINARTDLAINLSGNSVADVDRLSGRGSPVVTVVPKGTAKPIRTAAGRLIAICPAVLSDRFDCRSCGNGSPLCARKDRDYAIGFPAHGIARDRASRIAAGQSEVA